MNLFLSILPASYLLLSQPTLPVDGRGVFHPPPSGEIHHIVVGFDPGPLTITSCLDTLQVEGTGTVSFWSDCISPTRISLEE